MAYSRLGQRSTRRDHQKSVYNAWRDEILEMWQLVLFLSVVLSFRKGDVEAFSAEPGKVVASAFERSSYAVHWENLLLTEYEQTSSQLREKRKSWSRRRLEDSGISVFGGIAEPDTELFGEKIVRIVKPGETRFRDRFTRGDVLLFTPNTPGVDPVPRECLVVDVGRDWMSVGVGRTWPPGLWNSRKIVGFYEVRLDRTAPQAPLKAQRTSLNMLQFGYAGEAAELMAKLFQNATSAEHWSGRIPDDLDVDTMQPEILKAIEEAKSVTAFKPNKSQERAILWALSRKLSLIRGPPGTGKTRVAAMLISTALKLKRPSKEPHRVLAVTHSNGAADVLLEALIQMGVPAVRHGRPASVSPNVQHRTVVAMAERMPEVKKLRRVLADINTDGQRRSAAAYDLRQGTLDIQDMITRTAPVVVTSCIGAHQLLSKTDEEHNFSTVVLDEAAQTTEPALVCALVAAKADQVVLVGDTRQLPPTITAMELRDSLGMSPMARLEETGIDVFTLETQYRMSPSILKHPSKYFYKGLVGCADGIDATSRPSPKGFPWPSQTESLAFVQVGRGDAEVQHNFGGRSNPTEARIVVSIVAQVLSAGELEASQIAVISPYSKQVQLIRNELASIRSKNAHSVRIGTVDSFQGQETDFVVFSAVRSNELKELGFLRDSRRLCVAITRAKRGLVLVGDRIVLQTCRHWSALLKSCDERGCTMTASDLKTDKTTLLVSDRRSRDFDAVELFELDNEEDDLYGLFAPESRDSDPTTTST